MTEVSTIDLWYNHMTCADGHAQVEDVFAWLKKDTPSLVSVVFERTCNLQCAHCFYLPERATSPRSDKYGLGAILRNLVGQVLENRSTCKMLHAGRILRPWHIEVLSELAQRPETEIGLIDNGSFTGLINRFQANDFKLDWIDVSLDGTKAIHDRQRAKDGAFEIATNGLALAQEVTKKRGRVSSLFTLTSWNYFDVFATAKQVLALANEFHISPVSPRPGLEHLVVSPQHWNKAWDGIKATHSEFGQERIAVRIYGDVELAKFAQAVGYGKVAEAFMQCMVSPDTASVLLNIDGVRVSFFPVSLWPKEEILVDADGVYRMGYSGQFTLSEHARGKSSTGEEITHFTVGKLSEGSKFDNLYLKCVDSWRRLFGNEKLASERRVIQDILRKGGDFIG